LQPDIKSYTIVVEKQDHANISRSNALTAIDMHAVNGRPGSVLFAEARADTPGIRPLGAGSDLGPSYRPILRDLDETWQPAYSHAKLTQNIRSRAYTYPGKLRYPSWPNQGVKARGLY
jgi:hypothetical protein